jgi:DNA-binding NtrC family response regulator
MQKTLLLVTDESIVLKSIRISLEHAGFRVLVGENVQAARNQIDSCDCLIAEIRLPDGSAIDLLKEAKQIPCLFMVSQASLSLGIQAMRHGAFDCLTKPIDHEELIKSVRRAIQIRPSSAAQNMLGESPALETLKQQIQKVAPLDTTILIGGESGTGKELVATSIHHQSKRAAFEMISVNCAAIPESLIEAELFGHVKGAFTGANQDREGLIEAAHQSTLFLDEIGELPLAAQSRLLRVLQEGEIRRVGSTERTYVDVRLIAATHRDLLDMVSKGTFREDLYYRLNVIELDCPALRDRASDVLLLADAFLKRASGHMQRPDLYLSEAARIAIEQHSWPGNVRELQNAIERAVVLSDGPNIEPTDLGLKPVHRVETHFTGAEQFSLSQDNHAMMSLEDYFQHFVLTHQDHMSETELARRLGISRKSLWERRQRLGISRHKDENAGK